MSMEVVSGLMEPTSLQPTTWGRVRDTGWPSITASDSIPPTPGVRKAAHRKHFWMQVYGSYTLPGHFTGCKLNYSLLDIRFLWLSTVLNSLYPPKRWTNKQSQSWKCEKELFKKKLHPSPGCPVRLSWWCESQFPAHCQGRWNHRWPGPLWKDTPGSPGGLHRCPEEPHSHS